MNVYLKTKHNGYLTEGCEADDFFGQACITMKGRGVVPVICTIDKDNGLCLGCLRTINEISEWLYLDDKSKADILKKIKKRKIKKTDKFI